MAFSTKRFDLSPSAYQDISEGASDVTLRLGEWSRGGKAAVRVYLGTSLPAFDTDNYDLYTPGTAPIPVDIPFAALASTDRVYARGDREVVRIVAYRKGAA